MSDATVDAPPRPAVFDRDFYLQQRPDLAAAGVDLWRHYLEEGWREGLDPHPLFAAAWYVRWTPAAREEPPLLHYLREGEAAGAWPSPAFYPQWYARQAGLDGPADALAHYLRTGAARGLSPHPLLPPSRHRPPWRELRAAICEGVRAPAGQGPSTRFAVVAHVYYPELWPELAALLAGIEAPHDLFLTAPDDAPDLLARLARDRPDARVVPSPNRGRDIGPLLALLPRLSGYDAVCKLHTKRGQTEPEAWRLIAWRSLLGDPALVAAVTAAFWADPRLQLVGPRELYLSGETFIGPNRPALDRLTQQIYRRLTPPAWGFFAGSMFWFRPALLAPIADGTVAFDATVGNDGAEAHAVERLFGLAATLSGGRVGLVDMPGEQPGPRDLVFRDAPGPLVETELADTLPIRRRELAIPLRKLALRRRSDRPTAPRARAVTFVGPVEAQHGLGVSARGYVAALAAAGVPTRVVAFRDGFERVRKRPYTAPTSAPDGEPDINLVHLNLDLLTAAHAVENADLRDLLTPERLNIAIVSWELLAVRPEWSAALERFAAVWVASTFTQRALQAVTRTPVRVIRPALLLADTAPEPPPVALPPGFRFLYSADLGSVGARKNPQALWRAYAAAFAPDDGAACILKLHYAPAASPALAELRDLAAGRPDMLLVTEPFTDGQVRGLFEAADCYVSPHRSEGVGLTVLEAMAAGRPVVATRFGGVEDFVEDTTAEVVAHTLIEVGTDAEPYPPGAVWADPDEADLARALRAAFERRGQDDPRRAAARARVDQLFGLAATASAMDAELARLRGG